MDNYNTESYGERIADVYDEWYPQFEPGMIEVLKELALGGPALELGIGTGRIALPLLEAGVAVHGIDASPAMVEKLRRKPRGSEVHVTLGNFANVEVTGHYTLVYVLFNTFFALLTQDEQIRCLKNIAIHLTPGGCLLMEAFVPDLCRYSGQQSIRFVTQGEQDVRLNVSQLDPVGQLITSQQIVLSEQGVRLYPVKLRYAWPSELDLMARLAGLQLRQRWGNWQKGPFVAESIKHISVYELPPNPV